MAEITAEGVTGKTLLEYQQEIQQRYLEISADWNITPESPDGQQIGIWSEQLALLDEAVQYAYMSRDPATAAGQALDDIADYAGLERQEATFSTAQVTITGVDGTAIPAGNRVRNTETGTTWAIDSSVTISGPTAANVTCTTTGAKPASIGSLSEIADPVAGWQAVNNDASAALGRDEETDTQFRLRRDLSVAQPSQNQVDSIFAAVSNVDGVVQSRIYENPESTVDSNGLLDHSIAVFVQGGDVESLQTAIANNKNPGCGMNRDTGFPNAETATVETDMGNLVPITFFRPDLVDVYVSVTINTSQLSEGVKDEIKQAIVDFSVEGYTGSGAGFTQRGFRIGEVISSGKLFTPINEIVGGRGYVETVFVDTVSPATGQIVSIAFNELGVFNVDNIEVVYT